MDSTVEAIADELGRLTRLRERTLAQLVVKHRGEVDPAIYACLHKLVRLGPMRSGALAELVHSDPSTVSRHVSQLVDRGLVERTVDRGDGRAVLLAVTAEGRELAAQIGQRRHNALRQVVQGWPEAEQGAFLRLLREFVDRYERWRPEIVADFRAELQQAELQKCGAEREI